MSHHFSPDLAQIDEDPRERSWFARLVAPEGASTPTTIAFVLGALGTAAFIGSLASDWVTVSVTQSASTGDGNTAPPTTIDVVGSNTNIFVLGLVYSAGVVALLGFLGTVINRPEVALRSRMGAAGLGIGLLGVVIGSIMRLPQELVQPWSSDTPTTVAYQGGAFYAMAAAVLPVVAVWVAASPAARAVSGTSVAAASANTSGITSGITEAGVGRRGRARVVEPTAFAAPRPVFAPPGPIDLTVIPDDDRRV